MGFEDFLIFNMINKEKDKKEKDGFNDIIDDIFDNDNEENNDFWLAKAMYEARIFWASKFNILFNR